MTLQTHQYHNTEKNLILNQSCDFARNDDHCSSYFCSDPSYNQPTFSLCATWNPNAFTFANSNIVGSQPVGMFVDINNTVYVAAVNLNQVLVWLEGSNTPTRNISDNFQNPYGIFATITGDIFVDNGYINHRVDKWSWNATTSVTVMNTTSRCIGIFIDINDTFYCSNDMEHKIVKVSLHDGSNTVTIVAGNGTPGSEAHLLHNPNGIFVDGKFNLYVADWRNDRLQLFQPGQLNATTVAGSGAPGTIALDHPSAVILDADGYLFISDCFNHRIIRSGPFGFYCLLGCSGTAGAASNQLNRPYFLSFDSYGNLFVVDHYNNRIQKFHLMTNSCGKYTVLSLRRDRLRKLDKKQRVDSLEIPTITLDEPSITYEYMMVMIIRQT